MISKKIFSELGRDFDRTCTTSIEIEAYYAYEALNYNNLGLDSGHLPQKDFLERYVKDDDFRHEIKCVLLSYKLNNGLHDENIDETMKIAANRNKLERKLANSY